MILFIEDDLMLVAEVSDFLREHGFSVDVAESGAEALRRVGRAVPRRPAGVRRGGAGGGEADAKDLDQAGCDP